MSAKVGGERRRALRALVGCGAVLLACACDATLAPAGARVETRVSAKLPTGETRVFSLGRIVPPRATAEHTALAEKCLSASGIERASVRITMVGAGGPERDRTLRVWLDAMSGAVPWWDRHTSLSCGMDGSLKHAWPHQPREPVSFSLTPSVSLADAARAAMPILRRQCDFWEARRTGYVVELMIVDAPSSRAEQEPRLAWAISGIARCRNAPVFVDAHRGELLWQALDPVAGARAPGDHAPRSHIQVGSVSALQAADEAFWYHGAVFFPSTRVGYAAGYGGYVARTVDGGVTWTTLEAGIEAARRTDEATAGGVHGLFFHDAKEGYAAVADGSGGGLLARTVDGGEAWTTLETPPSWGALLDVAFWDRQRGVVVGWGTLATTHDGGATWQDHHAGSSGRRSPLYKVVLTGPSSAVVSGAGRLLRTEDGGTTWIDVDVGGADDLVALAFGSAQVGYAVGFGGMWKTADGGKTWSSLPSVPGRIGAMAFRDELRGIALVAARGRQCIHPEKTIIHVTQDGGQTWQSAPIGIGLDYLTDMHFPSQDKGFAVGSTGIVSLAWAL